MRPRGRGDLVATDLFGEPLLSNVQKTRDELLGENHGSYCSLLRDSNASTGDKLRAQQRIADLFSLEQPRPVRAVSTQPMASGALCVPSPRLLPV
jgi:hypothetical protein